MAIDNPPAFLQAGTYTASRDRLHLITSRFVPTFLNATDAAARGGFLPGQSGRGASYSMNNWDVTIGRFSAVVENTFATQGGDYQVLNLASQVLTVTASSPTTNRIDIIGVRVQDAFYTGALNQADIVVVQGTATAGTPAAPTLPASFLPVVQVTVNANTSTGVLTDLRKRTANPGAIYQPYTPQVVDVGTVVGEAQLLPASGAYPPRLRVWDGAAWRGVSSFAFATPGQAASGPIAPGADLTVGSLSVADPGFAYKLTVGASTECSLGTNSAGTPMAVAGTIDSTSSAGTGGQRVCYAFMRSAALGVGVSQGTLAAIPRASTVLTGAHTVRAITNNASGSITISVVAASPSVALTVVMEPA